MALQWGEIKLWPSSDMVIFMPSGLAQHFCRTRVILDCTDCPVKRPSRPIAQPATFSTYKNRNNTVTTLIGVTPAGLCSYMSATYRGTTSDCQICNVVKRRDPSYCITNGSLYLVGIYRKQ